MIAESNIPELNSMPKDVRIYEGDLYKIDGIVHVRVNDRWIEFQEAMNMKFVVEVEK